MSTRACYRFILENGPNDWPGVVTVYKRRSEKAYRDCVCGGGIRLVPSEGLDAHRRFASDTEYLYDIRCAGGKLRVTAYTTVERDGVWIVEKFFEGSTKQLARRKS